MFFSKSFGYAVRSILYIALVQEEHQYVQAEEIALHLNAPRHFVSKVLKMLAKAHVLVSAKGPSGGFRLPGQAYDMPLFQLYLLIDGTKSFEQCVLRVKKCNEHNPCPMHLQMSDVKNKMRRVLTETTISDLLTTEKAVIIRSISSEEIL